MNNLLIWNKVREVPKEAQKPITGGRLNGMTDINPVWRMKILTETFGICGFGWKYEIIEQKIEQAANDEISAFVTINLYVKQDGEWSAAIPGVGGSAFVAKEKNGPKTSDECFKMALTDAISVSCKALGIGADVYFSKDKTKYDQNNDNQTSQQEQKKGNLSDGQIKRTFAVAKTCGHSKEDIDGWIKAKFGKDSLTELTKLEYDQLITAMESKPKQQAQ